MMSKLVQDPVTKQWVVHSTKPKSEVVSYLVVYPYNQVGKFTMRGLAEWFARFKHVDHLYVITRKPHPRHKDEFVTESQKVLV